MLQRLGEYWLPRLLFLCTIVCALFLAGLVAFAPSFFAADAAWPAWLRLFAVDAVVRRTALASAAGLAATAFVFFRPKGFLLARKPRGRHAPDQVAGA